MNIVVFSYVNLELTLIKQPILKKKGSIHKNTHNFSAHSHSHLNLL